MGKIILPPLKYILFFLISSVLFLFISILYNWELYISLCSEQQNGLLVFLPAAASGVVFPSASAAILFLVFSSRKKTIHPVSAVIVAAAVFVLLYFGHNFAAEMSFPEDRIIYQPLNSETLHITDNSIIYTDDCSGETISGILVRNRKSILPGFKFYPSAKFDKSSGAGLVIDSERKISITPVNPIFSGVIRSTGLLGAYLRDISFLNANISLAAAGGGTDFIILSAIFTIFLMASLLFRKATAWPLFNIALILALHRLIFYLFRLFSEESEFISETFFSGSDYVNMPLITIAGLTAVLLLTGTLLSISSRRKAE